MLAEFEPLSNKDKFFAETPVAAFVEIVPDVAIALVIFMEVAPLILPSTTDPA